MRRDVAIACAIVSVPLLGYPIAMAARGDVRFPSVRECAQPPVEGQPVNVVFGRFDDPNRATALRDRVLSVGFTGTEMLGDGCGRWMVALLNVPSLVIAREVQREAATVDLKPTLEVGTSG